MYVTVFAVMAQRYKTRAELESAVIRVRLDDYYLLKRLSGQAGGSIADVLHTLLKGETPKARELPTQLPMNGFVRVNLAETTRLKLSDSVKMRLREE